MNFKLLLILSVLLSVLIPISLPAAQTRLIRVGAFNYYPGIFKDDDGVVKGFYVDALADLAEKENIRFEYVYGTWSEGLDRIKSGQIDLLTSVAFNDERAEYLDYTKTPLLTVWGELYVLPGSEIENIRQANGKRIGVMKSDVNGKYFIDLMRRFNLRAEYVEYGGFDEIFAAIAARSIDAGVVNNTFGTAKQIEYGLRSTGVVFNPFDIYFAVAKGKNKELLATLDQYLHTWIHQQDSVYNHSRNKWLHGSITVYQFPTWLKIIMGCTLILIAISMLFIFFLKRRVNAATSDLLQREAKLLESESKFRSYMDNSPYGVLVFDCSGRYMDANPAAAAMTGYSIDELLNMSITDLIPADSASILMGNFELLKKIGYIRVEKEYLHKKGSRLWRQISTVKLSDDRFLEFTIDITDRKMAEKALLDKNSELERFTYSVSHDLKSPLITIQTFADMIKQDLESENYSRAYTDLGKISAASFKMSCLLNDLLEISRIGKMIRSISRVDMNILIGDVLSQLAGLIKMKNVFVKIMPTLPDVSGDRQRIMAVVQNLIENAIKYSDVNKEIKIVIGTRSSVDECLFYIQDNGVGIDPKDQMQIFGLFSKLGTGTQGTGVGLALVKRIIEVHGGRVWVESEGVGYGSTFCFTLPGAPVEGI